MELEHRLRALRIHCEELCNMYISYMHFGKSQSRFFSEAVVRKKQVKPSHVY